MAKKPAPYKQRTRAHVIADLSVHHVEGFLLRAGHTAQRLTHDYGYDLVLMTFDGKGYPESGILYVQLKAAERLQTVGADYVFDIDIRDYNSWVAEKTLVVLILYDATEDHAVWLSVQNYFRAHAKRRPKKGAKTVRVRVPITQRFDADAVEEIRDLKNRWTPFDGGTP